MSPLDRRSWEAMNASVHDLKRLPPAPDGCEYALHPTAGACINFRGVWITVEAFVKLPRIVRVSIRTQRPRYV